MTQIFKTNKMKSINFNYYKKIDFLTKICLTLFIILPATMISGPLLSDIIVVVLSILFFLKLKKENIFLNYLPFFLFVFIICAYFFFNHLYLNKVDQNYLKSIFYFRFIIIIPFGIIIFNDIKKIRLLMYTMIITSIVIVIDISFQKYFGYNLTGIDAINSFNEGMHFEIGVSKLSEVSRFSGLFGNELIAGGYLSKLFFPSLFFLYFDLEKNKKFKNLKIKKLLIPGYIIIIIYGILLSGERAAFAVSIIIIFALTIYNFIVTKNFKNFIYLCLLLITLSFVISNNSKIHKRFITSTIGELFRNDTSKQSFESDKEYNLNNLSSNKHISHYLAAYDLAKKNILVGVGFKNFRNLCDDKKYICSTHPHNIFLEIFSSLGIIGVILFYSLLIFFYFFFLKRIEDNKIFYLYFFYVIFVFMFILPTGSILNNFYAILVFYQLMCFILVLKSYHLNENN